MDPAHQEDYTSSFLEPHRFTSLDIAPSAFLQVPYSLSSAQLRSLPGPTAFYQDFEQLTLPVHSSSNFTSDPAPPYPLALKTSVSDSELCKPAELRSKTPSYGSCSSRHSTVPIENEQNDFSFPSGQRYYLPTFTRMSSTRKISSAEKVQYIRALQDHQINTLVELRRVEKAFAILGTPDCSQPMTSAWSYYVDSHGLLTELRGLTKNYPFSSDCLDEAKRRVYSDPLSNRSWNLCWLVLSKVKNDQLIPYYARYQASLPAMWAGHSPSQEQLTQLTNAFVAEWNWSVDQMLRHWEHPPTR